MAGELHWDEALYDGSAAYYSVGRLAYPIAVADALSRAVPLDGRQRLLDVGCGTGSLTLLLAPRVSAAVGVDANADMVAAATVAAERAGATNVEWRHLPAEELPADLGRFDVVTFAQSFHWVDRPRVAAAVRRMLTPGGACVLVQATTHRGDASTDSLHHPRPPHDAITALVRAYLRPGRRAGSGPSPATRADDNDSLHNAGFSDAAHVEVPAAEVVTRTADQIVAAVFSLSTSAPHLFGANQERFESDLRALLRDVSPDGLFAERTRDIALDIWRP